MPEPETFSLQENFDNFNEEGFHELLKKKLEKSKKNKL